MKSITYAFPHGLIVLDTSRDAVSPFLAWATQFCFTGSMLTIACQHGQEGTTEVTIGAPEEVDPGYVPIVSGTLETPNRELIISTTDAGDLLVVPVPELSTIVRVWVNHRQWADKVHIGIGEAVDEVRLSRNVLV